ncbi:hypothetical protein MKW92_002136 [Papaver armeniacum]|nr:hypothetical protein MKW92_002136 [Papaver armeniacum]
MYFSLLINISLSIQSLELHNAQRGSSSGVHVEANSSDENVQQEVVIGGTAFVVDRDDELDGDTIGETDSSSFATSYDEDHSSTTTGLFRRNIRSWTRGSFLGSGSYGSVYEGFSDDGFFFAVKEICVSDLGNQGRQSVYQLEQEVALLSQFEHENIVQYLGTDKAEGNKLYIFLELVTKGSLVQLYQNHDLLDSQVSSYTRQILHGLRYLHDHDTTKLNDVKSCKGNAFWMAPEVVNRKSVGYGVPADIWSLGCTVLEMLTGQLPYAPQEWMQATYRIGKCEPPLVPNNLLEDARDFIQTCLQVKPEDRPTAVMLLDHPFVKRPLPASSG